MPLLLEPIATIIGGGCISILLTGSFQLLAQGPIPDPNTAGSWSFYGILIVAIVVLFVTGIGFLQWFARVWLKKQEEMQGQANSALKEQAAANDRLTQAIDKNTEATREQKLFFDHVLQDAVKETLRTPKRR